MVLKGKPAGFICFVAIVLITTWIIHRQISKPTTIKTTHIIIINRLLYNLRKECAAWNIDAAQNTMEDLKVELEHLNIIIPKEEYFPIENLKTLDSLVNLMSEKDQIKHQLPNVFKEINLLNESLDKIH